MMFSDLIVIYILALSLVVCSEIVTRRFQLSPTSTTSLQRGDAGRCGLRCASILPACTGFILTTTANISFPDNCACLSNAQERSGAEDTMCYQLITDNDQTTIPMLSTELTTPLGQDNGAESTPVMSSMGQTTPAVSWLTTTTTYQQTTTEEEAKV